MNSVFLPLGQVAGRINDIPSCQDVVEGTISEAEEVIRAMQGKVTA